MAFIADAVSEGQYKSLAAFVRQAVQKELIIYSRAKLVNFWSMFDAQGNIREGGIIAHSENESLRRFYEGVMGPLGLAEQVRTDRKWMKLQEEARSKGKTLLEYYIEKFPDELGSAFEGLSDKEKIAKAKELIVESLGVSNSQ